MNKPENKEMKFTPVDIDGVMANLKMLERMHDIVKYGIEHDLTAREVSIINREMNQVEAAVALQNEAAREEYIRRRLGLSNKDILTDAQMAEAFDIIRIGLTN
ncbi:hypothetical protein [Escherichia coli]|uniref:hypothetical protein n=1 Tax=Escherichia coli TaxID=562 RepID=UPI0039A57C0A